MRVLTHSDRNRAPSIALSTIACEKKINKKQYFNI